MDIHDKVKPMDARKDGEFVLEVLNIYAQLYAACTGTYYAMYASGYAARRAACDAAVDVTQYLEVSAREYLEVGEDAVVYVVGSLQKGVEASCRVGISKSKEIRAEVFKRAKPYLPTELKVIDKSKLISTLLDFKEGRLEELKLTIPLQLCNYFYLTERIIRSFKQVHLLEPHACLVKATGMEDRYKNLFRKFDATHLYQDLFPYLPRVLIRIIVEYCAFCWSLEGNEDEEEVYRQMICLR